MKKYSLSAGVGLLAVMPMVAMAQFGEIDSFLLNIINFINDVLIPLVFAAALLMFIFGMFRFFIAGGADDEKREQGKSLMLYAILGFVLMVSIFGIVNLIANGLGFGGNEEIENIPNVPTRNR